MATLLGSLLISLGFESGQFKSGLTAAEKQFKAATKRFEATGKSMSDLGQKMSLAVTLPLTAFAAKSVQGFQDQQQAMAQVNSALASMGTASGKTASELSKTADALEMNSLVDADVILKQITANLLTFGNVAGKQFDRAQQAALDMAQRMGGEPQAAAIMLGKALNDPIKGISALTRVGVQFTAAQQAQIKAMTEAGNTAGAQGIILSEVERQFKGAAKAAADTSPWRQAQVAFGQASDVIGEALLPAITAVSGIIKDLALAFTALPQSLQTGIVLFGGLAAVVGPVLIGLGAVVTTLAPFIAGLSAAFAAGGVVGLAQGAVAGLTAALGPLLIPIAAVATAGYLIYQNWDKVAPVLQTASDKAKVLFEDFKNFDSNFMANTSQGVSDFDKSLKDFNGTVAELDRQLGIPAPQVLFDSIGQGLKDIGASLVQSKTDYDVWAIGVNAKLKENGNYLWESMAAYGRWAEGIHATMLKIPEYVSAMVSAVGTWISNKLGAIWQGALDKINTVKQAFFGLYDAVVGHSYIPDMVDGIAAQMLRLDSVMVDKADKATSKTKAAFQKLAEELKPLMDRLFPEAAALNAYRGDLATINAGETAGAITNDQAAESRKRLAMEGRTSESAIGQILASSIDGSKLAEATDKLLQASKDAARGVEAANVRIVKSFKDTATETIGALQNMANSIKGGGFLDILSSVVNLGLQLGSVGAFGKSIQTNINLPRHANGTNFAPGGLSLVGERGPELVNLPRGSRVTPNSQIGGSTNVQVVPSPYFDVVVNGHIQRAAPAIVGASVSEMANRSAKARARSIG